MKKRCKIAGGIALGYLGSITPRLWNRPKQMPKVFYAHRGLHDNHSDAPENTLAAFQRAVDAGYGIELDVQLTKDGQVVVAHDFHLKRICGVDVSIDSLTYEELQAYTVRESHEHIPLFRDVLKLVDGKVPLIVELKVKDWKSDIARKADELLRSYDGVYCIESFHPAGLWWYRRHHPEICRGQLSWNYFQDKETRTLFFGLLTHLMFNFLTAPDFIAYDCLNKKELSMRLCRNIFGCSAVAWTVKSQAQLNECRPYFDYFIFEGFEPKE